MLARHLPVALCALSAAWAQSAGLSGVVRDATGLPIAGAALELAHAATGETQKATSAADGGYRFQAPRPGVYRLTVRQPLFALWTRDALILRAGGWTPLDVTLAVGPNSAAVDVAAEPGLLQTARGTVSFTAEERQVVNLPLDGRNFVPLLALSPGVNLPPGSTFPRINGSRPRVSEYLYDGLSVLQPEPGQVAFFPVIDAIEEFRVETNSYAAEYGRSNGGVILVNQKSGTNRWQGTLFEFFRHERLNARHLFAPSGPKPLFRRNQFGFVLGGPVRRNRTFFFVDAQATRLATGVARLATVPTAAQRDGRFASAVYDPLTAPRAPFPGNTIPAARLDPRANALADGYPATDQGGATNYRRVARDSTAALQWDARLDHVINARQRAFVRYSWLRDDTRPAQTLPGVTARTLTRADSVAAEHTWGLNQLRLGHTGRRFRRDGLQLGSAASYDIAGFQSLGPAPNSNGEFATRVTQVLDSFSWFRGRHAVKAGADLRWQALDVWLPPSPEGQYQFTNVFTAALDSSSAPLSGTGSSFASFLLGQVTRYQLDAQPAPLRPRARVAEFFVQDDLRLGSRLSLNAGVRYTLNFPSTVVDDRGAIFNLDTQRLDLLGVNGRPRTARRLEKANFAPRVGVAWQPRDTLVVRAGYGLTWIEQAGITTPFTTPLFPFIQTVAQQTLDNLIPAFVLARGATAVPPPPGPDAGLGQGVFGVQRDNGSGYAQQWNLSVQKTFRGNWSVEAGYLASKLTRLGVPDVNLNQLTVAQLALGAPLLQAAPNPFVGQFPSQPQFNGATIARAQLLRPYPRFGPVSLYRNNVGHSTYHSMQARLEKRFSRRFLATAAYTFSRLIDDAGAVFDSAVLIGPAIAFQAADSFNRRLEKDVSTGNMPHVFSASGVYELPRGWRLAVLARAQSGSPVPVTQAVNLNAFAGFGIQRPNRLRDPALAADQRTTSRWFDTSAFSAAPQFTLGNSSRNPVSGPGYRTLDVMLGKTIELGERRRAEFRAEAFNATNTPPLGAPNGQFGAPAFGTITTALDPRVYEFVVKLHF